MKILQKVRNVRGLFLISDNRGGGDGGGGGGWGAVILHFKSKLLEIKKIVFVLNLE